jgi:hypothetical protein
MPPPLKPPSNDHLCRWSIQILYGHIVTASLSPGGSWSPPARLSGPEADGYFSDPDIAISANWILS